MGIHYLILVLDTTYHVDISYLLGSLTVETLEK